MIATLTNFFSSTRCKVLVISLFLSLWGYGQQTVITGDLKKFHKVTLTWDAIDTNETAATFTDFRLNVTFTSPSGKTFLVPGYFAADGNAAESSAESGNKWRCHFTALEAGVWSYTVSFRTGQGVALNSDISDGTPVSIDGTNGTFSIAESDKSGKDFRSKGKLEYVGEHFLKWTTGEYFLKTGSNSPEVFLEYSEFDNTPRNEKRDFPPRTYAAHIPDWNDGDPIWKTNKGKGIIGAVNYLGEQDVNAHYFLTMSVYGDNDTVFPWITIDDRYVYDISKLDQWQIVFDQMMRKGIMVHFILTEGENQSLFEHFDGGGSFADSRKIYYRELIARFGYLNAITWNIGEENGWNRGSTWGRANTSTQQKNFAAYIENLLYYNDHITVENGPTSDDSIFNNLLGENSFTGASIQGRYSNVTQGRDRILKWRSQSILNNKNWVVTYDEPYTGGRDMPSQSVIRELVIWGTLTAGGAGYEFYVGSSNGIPMDFRLEDYRPYEAYWTAMRYGKELFIQNDIPFYEMENKDDLVTSGWCLGKDEAYYVIYLADGGSTTITIPGNDDYEVMWYNPRNGGNLSPGTITNISAGTDVSIGLPPSNIDLDWVAVLKADSESTTIAVTGIELSVESETLTIGGTIALEATISPSDATNTGIDWSSSNSNIATVNADGLVTAIAEGQATITATTVDGGFTDTAVITVEESVIPVTGLTLSPKTQTLEIGETVTLEATVSPSDATNNSIDWSSDDSNIATVNSEGLITALAEGQATITATAVDGGFNDTAVINVLPVSDGDSMTGFVLVDAGTDQDMLVLTDGLQIDYSEVSGLSLNVRGETDPVTVGSVGFTLTGPVSTTAAESVAPYALFGDTNGNYKGRSLPVGDYTLAGTPYSGAGLGGTPGQTLTIQFSIVDQGISNEPPLALAGATPLTGTAPLEVDFTGSGSTDDVGVTGYLWDFGDGSTASEADPVHTYGTAGEYTATLTVTDAEGLTGTASVNISAITGNLAPTALAGATPLTGTAPLEVDFTGSGSTDDVGVTGYLWDFGDGSTSSEADPVHTYGTAGEYTATLTVTDAEGLTGTVSLTISVLPVSDGDSMTGFVLVDAGTDQDMLVLTDGLQIDFSEVSGLSLNVRGETDPVTVGSVGFTLTGPVSTTATESVAPYALFGDTNGNYKGRSLPVGDYTLAGTPYSGAGLGGTPGQTLTIQFSIVDLNTPNNAVVSNKLIIYPNPVDAEVKVHFDLPTKIKEFKVYDINGRLIKEYISEEIDGAYFFDVDSFQNGIYFIRAIDDKGNMFQERMVIE